MSGLQAQGEAVNVSPYWVSAIVRGKTQQHAGYVWRDPNGWHVQCARRIDCATQGEAEFAVGQEPAIARRPPKAPPKAGPFDPGHFTDRASGFVVLSKGGRKLGGAIGRPEGGFDAFALGQEIGTFATEAATRSAIIRRAWRIDQERRQARKRPPETPESPESPR